MRLFKTTITLNHTNKPGLVTMNYCNPTDESAIKDMKKDMEVFKEKELTLHFPDFYLYFNPKLICNIKMNVELDRSAFI